MGNAPPKGTTCALTLAQAVMNSVTIPRGTEGGKLPIEFTQWVALKAPHMGTQGTYMVRSYVDMQWRSIDLSEANLDDGAPSLRTAVETGELNVANGLPTLKPYSVEEDAQVSKRRLSRLSQFPC